MEGEETKDEEMMEDGKMMEEMDKEGGGRPMEEEGWTMMGGQIATTYQGGEGRDGGGSARVECSDEGGKAGGGATHRGASSRGCTTRGSGNGG